jgi:hypothetical protein
MHIMGKKIHQDISKFRKLERKNKEVIGLKGIKGIILD